MRNLEKKLCFFASLFLSFLSSLSSPAKLNHSVNENKRQFGTELVTKQFSDDNKNFSGKKVYQLSLFGWQVESIYVDGRSISEAARPKGSKVKKQMVSEREANVIADMLYPKRERGSYRKQTNNANFISHFFEHGLVSYEMKLDKRRKNHIGVIGVRTVLYTDGLIFKDIMTNAYH